MMIRVWFVSVDCPPHDGHAKNAYNNAIVRRNPIWQAREVPFLQLSLSPSSSHTFCALPCSAASSSTRFALPPSQNSTIPPHLVITTAPPPHCPNYHPIRSTSLHSPPRSRPQLHFYDLHFISIRREKHYSSKLSASPFHPQKHIIPERSTPRAHNSFASGRGGRVGGFDVAFYCRVFPYVWH